MVVVVVVVVVGVVWWMVLVDIVGLVRGLYDCMSVYAYVW